jgi:hypothetical protein
MEAMQWILLYLSISHDRYSWEHLSQHGWNMPEHHHACPVFMFWLLAVHFAVALVDHIRGINTNSPCTCIIVELLLVSKVDYITRIPLYSLVLVLSTDETISIEICLICNGTDGARKCSAFRWIKHWQKRSLCTGRAGGFRPNTQCEQ